MTSLRVSLGPDRIAIRPHACPKCLGPMILARIKPLLVGWELHSLVGIHCDCVDGVVVEIDSMNRHSSEPKEPI